MDNEDRDRDKKHFMYPMDSRRGISLDVIKSHYIADGMSAEEIAEIAKLPIEQIRAIIEDNSLPELRKAYVIQGIQTIQNTQLQQSQKLMDLANNFKKLRIKQLHKILEDYVAYYSRHGDFIKRHPVSGEILKNQDGIPMQLRLPNISNELKDLKESVTMSEGVRQLMHRLDEIINTPKPAESAEDPDTINITDYQELFKVNE